MVKVALARCFNHHRMSPRPSTGSTEQRMLLHGKCKARWPAVGKILNQALVEQQPQTTNNLLWHEHTQQPAFLTASWLYKGEGA
jgi:hypothetical protein